jgi:hypothetical protein
VARIEHIDDVEGGDQPPSAFRRIRATSSMAMEASTVEDNIKAAMTRNLPPFWGLPQVFKFKGQTPIAIVGGGPTLAQTIDELRSFRHVMVCGSAHDHVVAQGIEPEYCVLLDPDPITCNYIRTPVPTCTYLVASMCDASVFEQLKHYPVAVWHCAGGVDPSIYNSEPAIGGGCTVTLRALSIAIILGYRHQHYFGFDSCFQGGEHHAYAAEDVAKPVDVRVSETGRTFLASGYMLAQATQFQDALRTQGHLFEPTIHGDGLIAEIMRQGRIKAEAMAA